MQHTINFMQHGSVLVRESIAGSVMLSVNVPGLSVPLILTPNEASLVAQAITISAKKAAEHAAYFAKNQQTQGV